MHDFEVKTKCRVCIEYCVYGYAIFLCEGRQLCCAASVPHKMGYMPHCNPHVGRKLTRYHVGSLICDAWNKSATVGNATKGFKVTGIFPFENNALPVQFFFALSDSEVLVPENTTQEEANSSSEVLINTPQINLQPAEPGTSSVKPPSPTKHLHKISPIPRLSQVTAKRRIKKTAVLLTSIDNRDAIKANLEK
ncbi:hypothetical protein AVEN_22996-1 [Araneus ventricosus]|uniref:Uncharacterized protein n=1 Tax=Araneus ventricosus TaxID=182803 RepID=A0A4Y2TUC4_ARAVE|nr:hypothetical protein AVEN_22996-1 [Araneus ventricosus]